MKPATSNLACSCGCLFPSRNPTRRKSGCGPGLGELLEIWGFPFIISATAEASDFKFSTQLEFAKAYHKITPRGKSGHGLGLGELPNILGFPYNISATAGASEFKFGIHLEFAKAHDKTTRRRKGRHGPALWVLPKIWGFPSQWLKLATSNLVHNLGLPRPTKNTQRKSRRSLGLGKVPNICRCPLIFLQRRAVLLALAELLVK